MYLLLFDVPHNNTHDLKISELSSASWNVKQYHLHSDIFHNYYPLMCVYAKLTTCDVASFATQASTGTEFSTAATSMAFTSSTCSRSSMNSSATSPLYTFTTPSPPNLHCCCRCCSSSYSTCNQCVRPSLQDASSCASFIQPPTPQPTLGPVESQTPKFQAPTKLVGSKYPERLALSAGFLEKQTLTEMLASLPLSEKIQLGFKQNDLIVDCTYDGQPCDET